MKLLRYIADKLYKYSTFSKLREPPILFEKKVDIQKIWCEMEVGEKQSIEEVKKAMIFLMAKDIANFLEVKIDYDPIRDKKVCKGRLKVINDKLD